MQFLQPVNTSDDSKIDLLDKGPRLSERQTASVTQQKSSDQNHGAHSHSFGGLLTSDMQRTLKQALQGSSEGSFQGSDGPEPSCKRLKSGAGPMDRFLSKRKP